MGKAIGIDLGTTNSVACYSDGKSHRVLLNPHNEDLTPSVVCCEKFDEEDEGQIIVGRAAVNQAKMFPKDTVYSAKRIIGRAFKDESVQRMKQTCNYEIVESTEPVKGLAAVVMGGKTYLPSDISAMVLQEIKRYSSTSLSSEVTHAVVTVPAYFRENEKAATREAGQKSGLVVKTLLPEPTAAALAYGIEADTSEGRFVLVFDLGGGTFDISILSVVDQNYNVLEVHGDHFLGGDDFDEKIVEMILQHVKKEFGHDLSQDKAFRVVAKSEAEKAKKALSGSESASIIVPQAARVDGDDINLKMRISRQQFEKSIGDYVECCTALVKEALKRQGMKADEFDDVLLVGGSTAVPLVYQSIEKLFGKEKVRRDVNPMHCVAIGAGILASRMKGIQCPDPACNTICEESMTVCSGCGGSLAVARSVHEGMEITDITANHFGVQAVQGSDPHAFKVLVQKGTELPMQRSESATLFTAEEGQARIRLPVYEGMGSSVLQNTPIGVVDYALPGDLPKGHAVDISLKLDRNSEALVTIKVEGFGWSKEERLQRELIDEEVDLDDPLLPEEDEEDEGVKFLAILEGYLERGERFLADYDGILSPTQKSRLRKALAAGQEVLDANNGELAKERVIEIDRLLMRCGTASLLDQSEFAAHQADSETAAQIKSLSAELKQQALNQNHAQVEQLSAPLGAVVRQVFQDAEDIDRIDAAQDFGGLLADREKQS